MAKQQTVAILAAPFIRLSRKRRAALVRERGRCVWRRVAERQIGTRTRVLIEGGENLPASAPPGWVRGRAANYFPVLFDPRQGQSGNWAEVEINALEEDALLGHIA